MKHLKYFHRISLKKKSERERKGNFKKQHFPTAETHYGFDFRETFIIVFVSVLTKRNEIFTKKKLKEKGEKAKRKRNRRK